MFQILIDGLPVAKFKNRDTAELGKLIATTSFREARNISIKEIVKKELLPSAFIWGEKKIKEVV